MVSDARITLTGHVLDSLSTAATQDLLRQAHAAHERPRCMCTPTGVVMYTARHADTILVKRFPHTASEHAPLCSSYLPPPQLSGLGQMLGGAIVEQGDETTLRLGFALSVRGSGRAPEPGAGDPPDTVSAAPARLTLRSVLHYLWQEAGLTSWSPRMDGRRNWGVVSYHLRQASNGVLVKGKPLHRRLFVPAPFSADRKTEIAGQRMRAWLPARHLPGKTSQLMLLVGEIKAFEPARFGHQVKIKHMPDAPVMLDTDLHDRAVKRFANELEMWQANPEGHLMMIGTFSVGRTGLASLVEFSLVMVDNHWLPYESEEERLLLATAIEQRRRFVKALRYNLPRAQQVASLVLTDTHPTTACYVLGDEQTSLEEINEGSGALGWAWRITEPLAAFPASQPRPTQNTEEQENSHE